ncbi:leukocyte elastase inhibitor [Clonorchis sinensis]|uniref:Leukocyte elastase inhibitor n=1 Tax=Clonorchis sinensis TaxID=79923 RepID=H2KUK4_CLOSI|nr:leukocyte elastase inhibitor [Clonorchis sinensis]
MATEMELYTSMAQFSSDMYSQVLAAQPVEAQNVFVSPLSVYVALLMTLVGAGGQTRLELRQSLHIPQQLECNEVHKMFGSVLMNQLMQSNDVNASMANRLFLLQNITLRDEFIDTLKKNYNAEAEMMNEYADMEARRKRINQWVSENTNSKIPELFAEGVLSDRSLIALVNAVYFKGIWKYQFDKAMTKNGSFHRLNGSAMEVPMMAMIGTFPCEDLPDMDAVAVKLPFGNSTWELLVVLPNQKDGLHNLTMHFCANDTLQALLAKPFALKQLEIGLPRFKLSELNPLDMKTLLQKMGLETLFSQSADLSNLSSTKNIFVSEFVHKATIDVNEEGAEAAAGSGVIIGRSRPMEFLVDHPFVMALVYNSTVPGFIGHVADPELL